jgi:CBS domain-containing protein
MDTRFFTLLPETTVAEAVKAFRRAGEELNRRVFGMMVTSPDGELLGMVSMYDILILMRPKHIHIWGEMHDIDVSGFMDECYLRAKSIPVGDLMTTDVITLTPDTHLLQIVDIMVRKHLRRIPVLDGGKVIGIVHISSVFFFLMER